MAQAVLSMCHVSASPKNCAQLFKLELLQSVNRERERERELCHPLVCLFILQGCHKKKMLLLASAIKFWPLQALVLIS